MQIILRLMYVASYTLEKRQIKKEKPQRDAEALALEAGLEWRRPTI